MQYSTNFAFKLPQLTDPANIADINYNFEWIDTNLPGLIENRVAGLEMALGVQGATIAYFESGYISSATIGSTMSFDRVTQPDYASAVMEVSEGDIVTITVTGAGLSSGGGAFAYTITDSNKVVLAKSSRNAALTDAAVTMPENAAYIVINNKISSQSNYSAVMGETNQVEKIAQTVVDANADTTLATKAEVNRINSGLELAYRKNGEIWAYGRVKGDNGYYVNYSTNRRRTVDYVGVSTGIYNADARNSDYSFCVYAYGVGTQWNYFGAYVETEGVGSFVKTDSGLTRLKYFDFSAYPTRKFRLVVLRDDNEAFATDDIPVIFGMSAVNDNIIEIDQTTRALESIVRPKTADPITLYHCTEDDTPVGVTRIGGSFRIVTTSTEFGTIIAGTSPIFYLQTPQDCCVHVSTNKSGVAFRTSVNEPETGGSVTWAGKITAQAPTKDAPWLVKGGTYIAVGAQSAFTEGQYIDICISPVAYQLKDDIPITAQMRQDIADNYNTVDNMSRVSDVYAALDEIENNSGNRMSHSDISDVIDDSTKIRAYKINTTPKYIDFEFDIQTSAPLFDKPKMLIIATLHGNERGNVLSLIEFCRNLLNNAEYADIAGRIEWHIIPVVNIWGYNHTMVDGQGNVIWYATDDNYTVVENTSELRGGVYRNGSNINLNRAFSDDDTETTAETRAVRDYFLANAPFVACVDLHQWYTAAGSSAPVIGMASMVVENNALLAKYQHGWEALAAGGGEAETYVRAKYGSESSWWAKQQLVYPYGEPNFTTPASSRTSRAYFAGAGGNTAHTDKAVTFSSTFESAMIMRFMTNVYTPYTEMERTCANVFTQKSLAALARAALEEFA